MSRQRISENGARPVSALGEGNPPPLGRLGALVFQPNNAEPLYWASLRAPTRIAGCALGYGPLPPAGKTFSPKGARAADRISPALSGRTPHASAFGKFGRRRPNKADQFFAWDRVCGAMPKELPTAARAAAGSGCIRNPRTAERSGCTAAEPYPLSRKGTVRVEQRHGQTNTETTMN